jgi:hypothetical protein
MPRRRGESIPVYVIISTALKYGFQMNKALHETHKEVLGQTTYAGAAGVFFGANSPKPNRATKQSPAGNFSSFCSSSKIKDLRATDWVVTAGKSGVRGIKTSGQTRTVYVPMPGGYNYVWNMTAAEIDHAEELGFTVADAPIDNAVWGSSPKPPRASKRLNGSQVTTFMKPQQSAIATATEKGWSVRGVNYELIP